MCSKDFVDVKRVTIYDLKNFPELERK